MRRSADLKLNLKVVSNAVWNQATLIGYLWPGPLPDQIVSLCPSPRFSASWTSYDRPSLDSTASQHGFWDSVRTFLRRPLLTSSTYLSLLEPCRNNDFSKAFDTVRRTASCSTCCLRWTSRMRSTINWIQNFYTGRSQCTRYGGDISRTTHIYTGQRPAGFWFGCGIIDNRRPTTSTRYQQHSEFWNMPTTHISSCRPSMRTEHMRRLSWCTLTIGLLRTSSRWTVPRVKNSCSVWGVRGRPVQSPPLSRGIQRVKFQHSRWPDDGSRPWLCQPSTHSRGLHGNGLALPYLGPSWWLRIGGHWHGHQGSPRASILCVLNTLCDGYSSPLLDVVSPVSPWSSSASFSGNDAMYTVTEKNGPPKHVKIILWIENVSDYFSLYHEMPSICNVHVKFHYN